MQQPVTSFIEAEWVTGENSDADGDGLIAEDTNGSLRFEQVIVHKVCTAKQHYLAHNKARAALIPKVPYHPALWMLESFTSAFQVTTEIDLISNAKSSPSTPSLQIDSPMRFASPASDGQTSGVAPGCGVPEREQHWCWYPSGSAVVQSPVKSLQSEDISPKPISTVVQPPPLPGRKKVNPRSNSVLYMPKNSWPPWWRAALVEVSASLKPLKWQRTGPL